MSRNLRSRANSGTLNFNMSSCKVLVFLVCGSVSLIAAAAQNASQRASDIHAPRTQVSGIAWRVQGEWREDSQLHALRSGDAILPGSLLIPSEPKSGPSITLLLPDGQRILYECFSEQDCSRGFRVPSLPQTPSAFAAHMLQEMGRLLLHDKGDSATGPAPGKRTVAHTTVAKREEALVTVGHDSTAKVGGLLSTLPDGTYTYNLVPLDPAQAAQFHVSLQKNSTLCTFPVPAAGLYRISLWDQQNTPRIDLFLAAIEPAQAVAFSSYPKAKKLLASWDEDYYGWPIHDLQRAYLESLEERASKAPDQLSAHKRQISAP